MSVCNNSDNQNPPTHKKNALKEIRGHEEEKNGDIRRKEEREREKEGGKQTKLYHQDR